MQDHCKEWMISGRMGEDVAHWVCERQAGNALLKIDNDEGGCGVELGERHLVLFDAVGQNSVALPGERRLR